MRFVFCSAMSIETQSRVFNFSAGPAVLPESVLRQVQRDLLSLPGVGSSIMEISHRSPAFDEILDNARGKLRELLQIPDSHEVIFLQGGSRLQFSMIPMNLSIKNEAAGYLVTGSWGQKAFEEASRLTNTKLVYSGKADGFKSVPVEDELEGLEEPLSFVHYTSNETIQGVQFHKDPDCNGTTLVCDASSDFLSRPIDVKNHGLIYACAQKNAGPAGLTIVIVRKDLMVDDFDGPSYLSYKNHADADSRYNTPPTFAIYVFGLVCEWLLNEVGGLNQIDQQNREKSKWVYDVIDAHPEFYLGHAARESRSDMNVTFNFSSNDLLETFISEAASHSLVSLGGHRSVGGIRASMYNAMPKEGARLLAEFMKDFAQRNV